MLDIKFIRENKDIVIAGAQKKRVKIDIEKLLELDNQRRELQVSVDDKRAQQNIASTAIAGAENSEKRIIIERMQNLKETLKLEEESLQGILKEWRGLMVQVPNVPDISVPDGESDADNKEVRTSGEVPKFSFEPKSHVELLLQNGMADYERGAKVAGFRGYFLKNDGRAWCGRLNDLSKTDL